LRGVTAYTGGVSSRQTRSSAVLATILILASALGGCSTLGLPFGPELAAAPQTVGTVPVKATLNDSVDPSDWQIVQRTVAAVPPDQTRIVEWSNPATGSTGSATAIAGAVGGSCRPFATTVSDPHGIRSYSGQLCRQSNGHWQLKSVSAADALFS
jgi:surface antigen